MLFAILLLAWGLRLWHLDRQALWWDEAVSWHLARLPLRELLAALQVPLHGIHPPLYYALLHYWTMAAGQSEFALRIVSVWASVLAVALLGRLAKDIGGRSMAPLAALLGALSPMWVFYAQEARMYALETLIALGATLLLFRILKTLTTQGLMATRWSWWAGYAVLAALSLWADYHPAVFLVAHNLVVLAWLAWARPANRAAIVWRWGGIQGIVVGLYGPWAPIALRQTLSYEGGGAPEAGLLPLLRFLSEVWRAFTLHTGIPRLLDMPRVLPEPLETAFLGAIACVFTLGLWRLLVQVKRCDPKSLPSLLFPLALLASSVALYSLLFWARPFLWPRYLMVVTPVFLLTLAQALRALGQWRATVYRAGLALMVSGAALSLLAFDLNPSLWRDDVRPALQALAARRTRDDLVVWDRWYYFVEYYGGFEAPRTLVVPPLPKEEVRTWVATQVQGAQGVLWATLDLVHPSVPDPHEEVPFLLENAGRLVEDLTFPPMRLRWYELPVYEQLAPPAVFGDVLQLEAFSLSPRDIPAAGVDQVEVRLRWRSLGPATMDLKYSLRVRRTDGVVVAQDDGFLFSRRNATARSWRPNELIFSVGRLPLPQLDVAGSYELMVLVYSQDLDANEVGPEVPERRGRYPVLAAFSRE